MAIRNRIRSIAGALIPAIDAAVTAALALKADKSANLSDLASASAARTNLGLGTAATTATTAYATAAQGALADSASQPGHTHSGVYQPADANIVSVSTPAENDFIQRGPSGWLTKSIEQVKTALGLGTAAYTASTAYATALGADDNYVTDAEKTNIGNLGTAAYTASTDYAASNKTIFALTSDVHIDHTTGSNQTRFDAIATQIEAENPPFVFFNGDTIDLGVIGLSGADLALIHASFDVINAPKYFAIGNHDTDNGDSITDVTAGSTARFYTAMRAVAGQGDTLGYYSFEADGIDYIVINSVELQAPTEGDYDISSTQKIWIQTTLAALRGPHRKLVVFSHVDPTETSSIYYRMPAATRSFLQGAFSNWAYSSGGRLLAVLTAHEHGANNASANRARTVGGVAYWNIIDGLNNGSSNIKALTSAAAPDAKKGWWKVQWNQAAKLFAIIGQNTMTDLSRTASILPAPAFQRFNGTNHAYSSGIVPDSTTEMVVVGRFRSTSGTQTMGVANGSERFYFGIISGTWYLGFGTAVNSGVAADTLTHEWKINSTGLFLDGVQIATAGAWATTAIVAYFASVRTDSNNVNFCSFDYTRGSITKAGVTTYFYPTLT